MQFCGARRRSVPTVLRFCDYEDTFLEGWNTVASQFGLACMCSWFANLRSQSGDCFDNSVNLRSYFLRRSETLLHLSLASHGRSHQSCTSQQVASCAYARWSLHLCKASTLCFLSLPRRQISIPRDTCVPGLQVFQQYCDSKIMKLPS